MKRKIDYLNYPMQKKMLKTKQPHKTQLAPKINNLQRAVGHIVWLKAPEIHTSVFFFTGSGSVVKMIKTKQNRLQGEPMKDQSKVNDLNRRKRAVPSQLKTKHLQMS